MITIHIIFLLFSEDSSNILLKQSEMATIQYDATLKQLSEVNKTVHSLVQMIGSTRQIIDDKLEWISNALGGTDMAVERLSVVLWHSGFLIASMIICAFLSARITTRFLVAVLPPLNLALSLSGDDNAQGPLSLALTMGVCIVGECDKINEKTVIDFMLIFI